MYYFPNWSRGVDVNIKAVNPPWFGPLPHHTQLPHRLVPRRAELLGVF